MMRWLAILISLPLMCCKTPSKPTASPPSRVYVKTASEAKAAGLSLAELSDLEAFFDFVHSGCRTRQHRLDPSLPRELRAELRNALTECFAKPLDPHFIVLGNDQHLLLGISFSPSTRRLQVMDHSILSGYDYFLFDRTPSGYEISHINGCLQSTIKIVKNRGRPYIITLNLPD